MNDFFQFEADFVDSLRCIPMQVRLKLDTCGVKLKLAHWHQFTQTERQTLLTMPCQTLEESQAYRQFLQALIEEKTGTPAAELPGDTNLPWQDETSIPESVQGKATEFGLDFTLEKWHNLTPLQRFALIKLSRPSHENRNFYPALQEFGLV
jgi:hypothetical protein